MHSSADRDGVARLPVVPGVSLGGIEIGAHISGYRDFLFEKKLNHLPVFPLGNWGSYWPLWGLELSVPPLKIHVDIRDGQIYRVDGVEGYEGEYSGLRIGISVREAKRRAPTLGVDGEGTALRLPEVQGLFFFVSHDEPSDLEEDALAELVLTSIVVHGVIKGPTLTC